METYSTSTSEVICGGEEFTIKFSDAMHDTMMKEEAHTCYLKLCIICTV